MPTSKHTATTTLIAFLQTVMSLGAMAHIRHATEVRMTEQ